MVKLTGSNLGERQRELNTKVKEAAAQCVNFDEIKETAEESDVDKLFKIDLASEYHNIEYIIEVLKSGDGLYISRALKCSWIFGDCFSQIINVDNLHNNVIPFMSYKMKKKLLTAISIHVRSEPRSAEFYKYCMDINLTNIALKFLNFTNDTFKMKVLKDRSNLRIFEFGTDHLKHFIGLSFTLADEYLRAFHEIRNIQVFHGLSCLYTVSGDKYLDLLEKHVKVGSDYNSMYLSLRISKSIMKQHKDRVLKMPSLYATILSKAPLAKYSTAEDVKIYAPAILPDKVELFWDQNFYNRYKLIFDKITVGKFEFVKQIFAAKYPEECFETDPLFYNKQYYKLMTTEEKEIWALGRIASNTEILGKDYRLYKFVSFEKSLEEIKKLVVITTDNIKRADMMLVLIDSAKTQRDVEKLMKYYYEKHGNEQKEIKEIFVNRVLRNFNVFEFDEDCWMAFNNMFHNLEVYSLTDFNSKGEYIIVALLYYIINQEEVPEAIRKEIKFELNFYALKMNTDKITEEQQEMVFQYLFKFYMAEIEKLTSEPYVGEVKNRLGRYINFTVILFNQFQKTRESVPKLVNELMNLDWAEFECHQQICNENKTEITNVDLYRDMRKDVKLLIEHLPLVKTIIESDFIIYNMSTVLKKLKTYFSNDIAKEYLKFFDSLLAEDQLKHKVTQAAAHGIFQLGDEKFKVDFMTKYAPKESVINHGEINDRLLQIQQAICAHACYSRPPVPLKTMLLYIKGDYVNFCLPTLHSYMVNLPLPVCLEFVESILNTTVSLQKEGIRFAFKCLDPKTLCILVLRAWKKNNDVSFRKIIYKAMFDKFSQVTSRQDILLLFDTLKQLTLTLRPDDDEEVFSLLKYCQIPDYLMPECIEISWEVVSRFPPNSKNLTRMNSMIKFICSRMNTIRHEFICDFIVSFIATAVQKEQNALTLSPEAIALYDSKWTLTATYILNIKDDFGSKINLTKFILKTCLQDTEIRARNCTSLNTCFNFIHKLESRSYYQHYPDYEHVNKIMQLILETFEETFLIEKGYMVLWEIRLGIVAREVIAESELKYTIRGITDELLIKNLTSNFANKLGFLIKEFVEKGIFFTSFFTKIQNIVTSKIHTMRCTINVRAELYHLQTYICLGLMSFEFTQIYLFVLNLLPVSCCSKYEKEFKAVIKKISEIDDKEIQSNLYEKFLVYSDFNGSALK